MIHTLKSLGGMFVAPHHLAAQAGRDVLRDGGNAVEAMVAAAAAIAVVYPHMNAIGGDGFWLIHEPGREPVAIDACGPAAALATPDFYAGHSAIPPRGPQAALTVAGTVGGWARALEAAQGWGPALRTAMPSISGSPLDRMPVAMLRALSACSTSRFSGKAERWRYWFIKREAASACWAQCSRAAGTSALMLWRRARSVRSQKGR